MPPLPTLPPRNIARVGFLLLIVLAAAPLGAAQGGPDSFGYTWKDSAEGVPIENIGYDDIPATALPGRAEWLSSEIPLPFEFFFYGQRHSSVWISDNGWVSFLRQQDSNPVSRFLPDNREPEAFLAVLWEDVLTDVVWWGPILDGTGFKIRWTAHQRTPTGTQDAIVNVYLYDDGRFRYSYFEAYDSGSTAVGMEDETERLGMTLLYGGTAYDGFSLGHRYAVEFSPPENLDCGGAPVIRCGESTVFSLPGAGPPPDADYYSCSTSPYTARERVLALEIDRPMDVQAAISEFAPRNLDLFLLEECSELECIDGGLDTIQHEVLSGQTLYLSVDGQLPADEGSFRVTVSCNDPYTPLSCGEIRAGNIPPGPGRRDEHSCVDPGAEYGGPDRAYYVCLTEPSTLRYRLRNTNELDIIAYRGGLEPEQCEDWGRDEITIFGADVGCHYVYVDGPTGSGGTFELEVSCEPYLDCSRSIPLACGETVWADSWRDGDARVELYSCTSDLYDGAEVVFFLDNPAKQGVSLILRSDIPEMDVLLLEEGMCDEGFCRRAADEILNASGLDPGSWPVVVDTMGGLSGPFELTAYCGRSISPASVEAWLAPGTSIPEEKQVTLTPDIPMADVMFAIDLTGSMGEELENLRTASKEIINRMAHLVDDLRFGLIYFMDYPGEFDPTPENCGYGGWYGLTSDEPYRLALPLTDQVLDFESVLDLLILGNGGDEPESYARAFWEAVEDPRVGWRDGARHLLVTLGDAYPHDCDVGACVGEPDVVMGKDPGRDEVPGTLDDLFILDVLDQMAAENLILLYFDSSGEPAYQGYWDCWTARTGGSMQVLNPDGTVPGGVDLADLILDTIEDRAGRCDHLTLRPSAGFEDWLIHIDPTEYLDVDLPQVLDFDIRLGPPPGTLPGDYTFTVDVVCDGAVVAQQQVTIHVGPCAVIAAAPDDTGACEGATFDLTGSASQVLGCNGEAQYQWRRDGSILRPWDTNPDTTDVIGPSPATYTLEVRCFGDPECLGVSTDSFMTTPLPDDIPPPVGSSLRVVRSDRDLVLSWADPNPPGSVSTYQLLVQDGSALWPPDPATIENAPIVGEVQQQVGSTVHVGAVDVPCTILSNSSPCRLLCYQVRATSPCSATPGSTCDGFPMQVPCP